MPSRIRNGRTWSRYVIQVSFAAAIWLFVSYCVAYSLTRRPHAWFAEPVPSVAWGRLEALAIEARDGHRLGAWYAEGGADAPCVLLLHGNGGSRRNMLDRAELFASAGCAVLLVSLRAHGDSTGDFNDIGRAHATT